MIDARLRRAVDAAVGWYEEIFALHGISTVLADGLWSGTEPAPPLHSDAISVEPGVTAAAVSERLAEREHAAFADAFAEVDGTDLGMSLLFSATWIHRDPEPAHRSRPADGWQRVTDPAVLADWNAAWGTGDVLLPGILERAAVLVLERRHRGRPTAGAVARLAGGCVYISNVHGVGGEEVDWVDLTAAIGAWLPDRPMVDYERGEDLERARAAGWEAVGEHRVWVR